MSKKISPRDLKILSIYLDGQLSAKDAGRLEARLATDAHLQQTLREMRQTRLLLRNAKSVHVPRHFTISAERAAQLRPARKPFLLPALSFSSLAAALLLVFALGFEFIPAYVRGVAFSPAESLGYASQAPMLESLDLQSSERAAEPPMIIQWGVPGQSGGGFGQGGGNDLAFADMPSGKNADIPEILPSMDLPPAVPPVTEQPLMPQEPPLVENTATPQELPDSSTLMIEPSLEATDEMEPTQTAQPTPEPTATPTAQPTATCTMEPTCTPTPQPTHTPTQAALEGTGPILGIVAAAEADTYNQTVLEILSEQEPLSLRVNGSAVFPWLRPLQISLGLFTLLSGISALVIWRRTRP